MRSRSTSSVRASTTRRRLVSVGHVVAWIALAAGWCLAVASITPVAAESASEVLQVDFHLWGE